MKMKKPFLLMLGILTLTLSLVSHSANAEDGSCSSITAMVPDLVDAGLVHKNGYFYYTTGDNKLVWTWTEYTVYRGTDGKGYMDNPMNCGDSDDDNNDDNTGNDSCDSITGAADPDLLSAGLVEEDASSYYFTTYKTTGDKQRIWSWGTHTVYKGADGKGYMDDPMNCGEADDDVDTSLTVPVLSSETISSTEIAISWVLEKDDANVAGYKIYRDNTEIDSTDKEYYDDTGLSPDTYYCYTIKSYDNAGNLSLNSNEECLYTGADENPTTPENLIVTAISDSQIDVSWNASIDDVEVAGYKIYRDSSEIDSTAQITYRDADLKPETTYCYTVIAYDNAGNLSGVQTEQCATTKEYINPGQCSTPAYDPDFWNNDSEIKQNNNCYNYATNVITESVAHPGSGSGKPAEMPISCDKVYNAAISDGLVPVSSLEESCPDNMTKVALRLYSNIDYHWLRQDSNGYWSHKPGYARVQNLDNNEELITNPENAYLPFYPDFCGYLCVCSDEQQGNGHANVGAYEK